MPLGSAMKLQERLRVASEEGKSYVAPAPNSHAYSVSQLMFGNKDWAEDVDTWRRKNYKRIEKMVRKRKPVDYRDEIGMSRMDNCFIYNDPEDPAGNYIDFACRFLWRPDVFEGMLLSSGDMLACTMLAARSGCDYGQIVKLSDKVLKIFNSEYIAYEDRVLAEHPAIKVPFPCLGDWGRATMLMRTSGKIVIAKFMLGLFFIVNDVWSENIGIIEPHLPKMEIPEDKSCISGMGDIELDDNPTASAEALAERIERGNRRASGTAISSLADMEDMF